MGCAALSGLKKQKALISLPPRDHRDQASLASRSIAPAPRSVQEMTLHVCSTFALADGHGLGIIPFCCEVGGLDGILGVLQLNVYAKRFIEHFAGFSLSTPSIGHGLFDADDLIAVRALAEAMTGAIHFVLWPQPARTGQFWFFHAPSVPQAGRRGYPFGYSN